MIWWGRLWRKGKRVKGEEAKRDRSGGGRGGLALREGPKQSLGGNVAFPSWRLGTRVTKGDNPWKLVILRHWRIWWLFSLG
jgi:hypothetical protein